MIDTAVEFSGVTKRYKHFTLDRINRHFALNSL
jgi:hypothetical protein